MADRVDAMADRVLDFIRENERFWRTRIRTSLDRWLEGEDPAPLRRSYRIPWIRAALEPARGLLDAEAHERLLRSLVVLTSGEAMIVSRTPWACRGRRPRTPSAGRYGR